MMKSISAFSLVELSIVLVILGLLTGGILTGQNLIKAAETRKLSTQLSTLQSAIYSFRDKYFYLPGDMPNATQFWGSKGGNGSDITCFNAASFTATCNGDGNGYVYDTSGDSNKVSWQHLQRSGLIEGNYNGDHDQIPGIPGTTHPATIRGGLVSLVTHPNANAGNSNYFPKTGKRHAIYSAIADTQGILSSEEMWNLDTKLDDGLPAKGRVLQMKPTSTWGGSNCTTSSDPDVAKYNVSSESAHCNFYYTY